MKNNTCKNQNDCNSIPLINENKDIWSNKINVRRLSGMQD